MSKKFSFALFYTILLTGKQYFLYLKCCNIALYGENKFKGIQFLEDLRQNYGQLPHKACADSVYGSEENYHYLDNNNVEVYVKYNHFHKEQKKAFKNNAFVQENLYYNSAKKRKRIYVGHMGL